MTALHQAATAGLRGAYWDPARLPEGTHLSVHPLRTHDGQIVTGYLLAQGDESRVAIFMHPREFMVPHYLAAELLREGTAFFAVAPRLTGNDIRLEHEIAVHDLAAALSFLRDRGYARRIALGNSGGGPLWALYNQQALLAPDRRIARTPGGRPTKLDTAELIPPDGIIFVSAHLGQGRLLMSGIDPSVTDEGDAFSVDPALDPFAASNGFSDRGAAYAPDFVARYRAAQRDRIARIDTIARDAIAVKQAARRRAKESANPRDRARAAYANIFPVWRTDADLRCWDVTLDPSERRLGSLWGADPFVSNYGSIAFGRLCTPESWLSTWSGLSSNASMEACAPAIEQPTLMIEYSGDQSTFPGDNDTLFDWIGTAAKTRARFSGDHHGRSIRPGDPDPRPDVGALIATWLRDTPMGEH